MTLDIESGRVYLRDMEEREIDAVLADDLAPGDSFMADSGLVTVVKRLEDESLEENDFIRVLGDDDEEYAFIWDSLVTLYGY